MATDFVDVAAHSVVFFRCIKASLRTHPGKNYFGIFILTSKITIHESFLSLPHTQKNTRLHVI